MSPIKKFNSPVAPLSPSKGSLENRIDSGLKIIQEEIKTLLGDYRMTFEGRMNLLKSRVESYKCTEDDSRSKAILKVYQQAVNELESEQQTVSQHLLKVHQEDAALMETMIPLCIDYALLDKKPRLHLSTDGVPERIGEHFYFSQLKKFDEMHPTAEIKQAIEALEWMMRLLSYRENSREIPRSVHRFFTDLWMLLKKLKNQSIPYVFFPISTTEHVMAAKIEWSKERGYVFTITNTGEGRRFIKKNMTSDLVYHHLKAIDLIEIGCISCTSFDKASDFYLKVHRMLSQKRQNLERLQGRTYRMQSGASCSLQALSKLIHGVLPDPIYRSFKAFATEWALGLIEPGNRFNAAKSLLNKRKNKLVLQ